MGRKGDNWNWTAYVLLDWGAFYVYYIFGIALCDDMNQMYSSSENLYLVSRYVEVGSLSIAVISDPVKNHETTSK